MQQRDKKIVWGIAGLVGLYVGWGFFHSWFIKPLNDLDEQIATATTAIDVATAGKRQLRAAEAALADARRMSLPKNPSEARRLYLRWIEELTAACGIQTTKNPEAQNERTEQGTLTAYPVKVEGIATYEQALLFLKRFSQVNLLQRLSQFDLLITSPGDPRLIIRFTAEGVAVTGAADRATLFQETMLVDGLSPTQTLLTVAESKGFPEKAPFRIKVGQEWMDVTAVNKNQWTVVRGVDQSTAGTFGQGQTVSLFPLRAETPVEPSVEKAYEKLAGVNPFRKPRPPIEYKPRLSPSGSLVVTKGAPWTLTLKAESWDPEAGAAKFAVEGEAPAGLKIDETTGVIKWEPAKDFAPGEYKVKVAAVGSYNAEIRTSTELAIKVRDANQSPKFPELRPAPAYLGRQWTLNAAATDADAKDQLKYSLSGTPPMGATIDAAGLVSWTPSEDMETGEVTVSLTVTDNGDPPLSATKSVNVRVEEDAARFTKFVGVVTEEGVQEAWFFDPSVNRNTKLKLGSLFRFADINGTLDAIHPNGDYVVLATGGKKMRLLSGQTIRQMTPEPETSAAEPVATPPAEEKGPPAPKGTPGA
ncbi:Putative Ig domain protein [Caulifigura coniformis]|uniref:Ig domain protein n=1 Tax=Caulifigura coniformis TaxID=2527983 RepID=A0A517SAS8_9PLAN|nr:putative Ig domain-containing protein [Caulifigura coniformis]QDT53222.1 Putative Ig domain protein [Caulifigura coniformis]